MKMKQRKREVKVTVEILMHKLLPLILMMLLFMIASSIGVAAVAGPHAPGMD